MDLKYIIYSKKLLNTKYEIQYKMGNISKPSFISRTGDMYVLLYHLTAIVYNKKYHHQSQARAFSNIVTIKINNPLPERVPNPRIHPLST
jgi:hypothetical protein